MNHQSLQPGTSFGRYEIHQRIARGGMGEVWFATAHGEGGFRKKVVIKTVRPDLAAHPSYIRMLIQEASLAAQLGHPNIVQVFDLGCTDGIYYIAMEYLPGRTLAQILQRVRRDGGQVPVWLALSVAASCCDGLQYAHDRRDEQGRPLGLLHQDISPSNIMLSFTGHVTILDFGVARAIESDADTRTQSLKGKYHYMAPERIQGLAADCRSDIYSLGVVMYQLLTLHRPFAGATEYELLNRIVREPPPLPSRYAPWLPADVERLVIRSLAKDPGDRHPNAYGLGAEIRGCLRAIGEIHEARDRAEYISALFPESPDSMANQSAMASLATRDAPGAHQQPASPVQSARALAPEHDIDIFSLPPDFPSDPAGDAIREDLRPSAPPSAEPVRASTAALFGEPQPVPSLYEDGQAERSESYVVGDIFAARGPRADDTDVFHAYNTRPHKSTMRGDGPDFYRTRRSNSTLDYWPWGSDSVQRKAKD